MIKKALCFTDKGAMTIDRLNKAYADQGMESLEGYYISEEPDKYRHLTRYEGRVDEWMRESFDSHAVIVFVGALGIAVRALKSIADDKLSDSPVIVMDDNGLFVIPLLSGHAGGANKVALTIAELIGAVPVITTSTDVNGTFSVDSFAVENNLKIVNRDGIKKVSAKAIEGKPVSISIKNYPPKEAVDVLVSDEADAEYSLMLSPKPYVVGVGLKKDKDSEEFEAFILKALSEHDIDIKSVYALATIDIKETEAAVRSFSDAYRIPVIGFDKEVLAKAEGEFTASDFVRETVGVDNVCERAAVLAAGPGSELLMRKYAENGMTVAIAIRKRGLGL